MIDDLDGFGYISAAAGSLPDDAELFADATNLVILLFDSALSCDV